MRKNLPGILIGSWITGLGDTIMWSRSVSDHCFDHSAQDLLLRTPVHVLAALIWRHLHSFSELSAPLVSSSDVP